MSDSHSDNILQFRADSRAHPYIRIRSPPRQHLDDTSVVEQVVGGVRRQRQHQFPLIGGET